MPDFRVSTTLKFRYIFQESRYFLPILTYQTPILQPIQLNLAQSYLSYLT